MKTLSDHSGVDRQIATLLTCKPLPESEVRELCEKVVVGPFRPRRSSPRNPMLSQCGHQSSSAGTSTANSTT